MIYKVGEKMSNDNSQDITRGSADQVSKAGKTVGKKLVQKGLEKASKWLKKLAMDLLKKVVVSILKAILAYIGPIGLLVIFGILIVAMLLEAVTDSDWYLKAGARSQAEIQADKEYEQKYRDLADASVAELDNVKANPDWITEMKKLSKPNWGIAAALARYNIIRQDQGITLPDPEEMYIGLKPTFEYKEITDDEKRIKTVRRCCTKDGCTTSTDIDKKTLPAHMVLTLVKTPFGETPIATVVKHYPGEIFAPDPPKEWEFIESHESGHCTITTYQQWDETSVDDRGVPVLTVDPEKFKAFLRSKGVKDEDFKLILELADQADEYFFKDQYNGNTGEGNYDDSIGNTDVPDVSMLDGWAWPVEKNRIVTSDYGGRWGTFHYGSDLGGSAAKGSRILAARNGVVLLAQFSSSYGNWVIVGHEGGMQTRYAHMTSFGVRVGQQVIAGQPIGIIGTTGQSTGTHLHFEVLKHGNKSPFIRSKYMEASYDPMMFIGALRAKR